MRRRRHDCGWLRKVRERLADELLCDCPNEDGHEAVREAAMGLAGRLVVLLDEHEERKLNQQAQHHATSSNPFLTSPTSRWT